MFPSKMVSYLLKRLELDYYRATITDGYSCGTRRKLSTALALVGHPQILLLVRNPPGNTAAQLIAKADIKYLTAYMQLLLF